MLTMNEMNDAVLDEFGSVWLDVMIWICQSDVFNSGQDSVRKATLRWCSMKHTLAKIGSIAYVRRSESHTNNRKSRNSRNCQRLWNFDEHK